MTISRKQQITREEMKRLESRDWRTESVRVGGMPDFASLEVSDYVRPDRQARMINNPLRDTPATKFSSQYDGSPGAFRKLTRSDWEKGREGVAKSMAALIDGKRRPITSTAFRHDALRWARLGPARLTVELVEHDGIDTVICRHTSNEIEPGDTFARIRLPNGKRIALSAGAFNSRYIPSRAQLNTIAGRDTPLPHSIDIVSGRRASYASQAQRWAGFAFVEATNDELSCSIGGNRILKGDSFIQIVTSTGQTLSVDVPTFNSDAMFAAPENWNIEPPAWLIAAATGKKPPR